MLYKVKYSKNAEKFIKKNKEYGLKFYKAFKDLSEDKESFFRYDIKIFRCSERDVFRLRVGKYRAIFKVVDDEVVIFVFDIDSRGDIYK